MGRGYSVLYDQMGIFNRLAECIPAEPSACRGSGKDYQNMVGDFWYHMVWAAKKLRRGELWAAKVCVDGYMKNLLLRMIELYEKSRHQDGYDTWHQGRMLEKGAGKDVTDELRSCFARYDEKEVAYALLHTAGLFSKLAAACADEYGFCRMEKEEAYAKQVYGARLEKYY